MRWAIAFILFLASSGLSVALARTLPLEEWADGEFAEIASDASSSGDFQAAATDANEVFELVLTWCSFREPGAIVEAAAWSRHYELMAAQPAASAVWAHGWLAEREGVRAALVNLVHPRSDDVGGVYSVLRRLVAWDERAVEAFPELAAAVAVVFDRGPVPRRMEYGCADPADAVEIFQHFVLNQRSLAIDHSRLPGEALVFVVDVSASVADLRWALGRHRKNALIETLYEDVPYDNQMFRRGKKATDDAKNNVPLSRYTTLGGVCRHQAHFTATVGKAIGVPTAYARADGPDTGHAFVGFMRFEGRRALWDFDVGRWDDYQNVRGEVRCPQTGRVIGDQIVGTTAMLVGVRLEDRWAASGFAFAARRVMLGHASMGGVDSAGGVNPALEMLKTRGEAPRNGRVRGCLTEPRRLTAETVFELLGMSDDLVPGHPLAWAALKDAARLMDDDARAEVYKRAARRFARSPDMRLTLLKRMIETIEDPRTADDAWRWAQREMASTPQFSAEITVARASALSDAAKLDAAWSELSRAARAGAVHGPPAVTALRQLERLVADQGAAERAVSALCALYGDVFRRIPVPTQSAMEYWIWSSHYRVGARYAELLELDGNLNKAEEVRRRIRFNPLRPSPPIAPVVLPGG